MSKHYTAYTDGAYSPSRDSGGIGIVIIQEGKVILEYSKQYKKTTNNQMEIMAIMTALASIKNKIDSFEVISDSQYCLGCITKGWKRKKNVSLWEKFDTIYEKAKTFCSNITFSWVKGHDDNEFNNRADKLAVRASNYESSEN